MIALLPRARLGFSGTRRGWWWWWCGILSDLCFATCCLAILKREDIYQGIVTYLSSIPPSYQRSFLRSFIGNWMRQTERQTHKQKETERQKGRYVSSRKTGFWYVCLAHTHEMLIRRKLPEYERKQARSSSFHFLVKRLRKREDGREYDFHRIVDSPLLSMLIFLHLRFR